MARDIELAVVAADDAFKDAGLKSKAYTDAPTIDSSAIRVQHRRGLDQLRIERINRRDGCGPARATSLISSNGAREGMDQLTPLWLLKYLPNMLACHVTIIHGLKGPSNTITCADASSHLAIGEAFRTIQRGKADLAICGGAESKVNPMGLMRHCLLKRLNETSQRFACRQQCGPSMPQAAGTAIAEGGGLLILEEYEHAKQRNAKIYAELVGFGASQDAYSVTDPDPTGHSYGAAIRKALKEAQVSPADVKCLVPHGLGIPSHDAAELAGLRATFGDGLEQLPLAPIKGQIGNLAAGCGVDAAVAVLAAHHGKIPGEVNRSQAAGNVRLNMDRCPRDGNFDVTVSSVYSLGGQNAALVFRKMQ